MMCPYKQEAAPDNSENAHYIDCIGILCPWFVSTSKCGLTMCSSMQRFDDGEVKNNG